MNSIGPSPISRAARDRQHDLRHLVSPRDRPVRARRFLPRQPHRLPGRSPSPRIRASSLGPPTGCGCRSAAPVAARKQRRCSIAGPNQITPVTNAYTRRLQLYRGEIGPDAVLTPADTDDVQVATLAYGIGNWYLVRGDKAQARVWFERSIQSGGWPGFGFILSEVELSRVR